ncbi:hypothetical protein GIB67_019954 [Kingdonia uniflora]|uniref:C2H2-type domain-containing protein n=1 Tax=Kingdonia uniflora TaxID=39325 RepID=A0A7J7ML14_9MAGN|nr:hypothetical protein GIB67_019954 [Kingdonia uniflora]
MAEKLKLDQEFVEETEGEEDFEEQNEDWEDWSENDDDLNSSFLCLFCDSKFDSSDTLFDHCSFNHSFGFKGIRKTLDLDFYDSFKLINYIRSQVSGNKCWSCGHKFQSNKDLLNHLHEAIDLKGLKPVFGDDKYLKPFMEEDSLLHSFGEEDEDDEEESMASVDNREELMQVFGKVNGDLEKLLDEPGENVLDITAPGGDPLGDTIKSLEKITVNGAGNGDMGPDDQKQKPKSRGVSFANVVAKEIKNVNDNYFGAYSSFGIHREMISDKVRMDAYRGAILNNPSLMNDVTVMDVGCGTGILSLFAAQAGAASVFAVEGSSKMASVATQIAQENGRLRVANSSLDNGKCTGVINVVQGMIEDLDDEQIPPNSVDVLLSEWMGYCLLYESMLSSVLYARDRWLKPGGAILPDTATIFAAGFGRGGTSIPFWENVYGFDMSCIGKEVVEDSAQLPIVDVVDTRDIVTESVAVQTFDLMTMKTDEMDFTTTFELHPKSNISEEGGPVTWCHGVALWFDTGFTSRFCKEMPTVLSTSPYTPKTHWSQTIFTFTEPIAMGTGEFRTDCSTSIGTSASPATRIQLRISIVRSSQHRSIDISLETSGISSDGQKRCWPVQIFNL